MLDIEKYRMSKHIWPQASVTTGLGSVRWTVEAVHKLTPDENQGKHHIYIILLNDNHEFIYSPPFETKVEYTWEGRREDELAPVVALEKKYPEPIANIPMYKGQKITVWIKDSDFGSDSVSGLTVDLPDESTGNTYGHHSYLIVFKLSDMRQHENPTIPSEDDVKFIINSRVIEELDEIALKVNNLKNAILSGFSQA